MNGGVIVVKVCYNEYVGLLILKLISDSLIVITVW